MSAAPVEQLAELSQAREPRHGWRNHAKCAGVWLFTQDDITLDERAICKDICLSCPVYVDCWLDCQRVEDGCGPKTRFNFRAGCTPVERAKWPKITHDCPVCGNQFTKHRAMQETCSRKCADKFYVNKRKYM